MGYGCPARRKRPSVIEPRPESDTDMSEPLPVPTPAQSRIKVPPIYEAIMRWIAANPAATLQEGARQFKVSAGWYSTVINSDLFIARYQEWLSELDEKLLLPALMDRVNGNASLAMEKLATLLEQTNDPDVVLKASDTLLKATKPGPVNIHQTINGNAQQVFSLDSRLAAIQAARRTALDQARGNALPVSTIAEIAVPVGDSVLLDRLEVVEPAEIVEISPTTVAEQALAAIPEGDGK